MYEALKAFEATYEIDKSRESLPEKAFFRDSVGGFYPPFGVVSKKRVRITTKNFPEDKSAFFFEFGHPPLQNYIQKLIAVGILPDFAAPVVGFFVKGYTGEPFVEPPEELRQQASYDPEIREQIEDVRVAYQRGLELYNTSGVKEWLEKEKEEYEKNLEERVRDNPAIQRANSSILSRILNFVRAR